MIKNIIIFTLFLANCFAYEINRDDVVETVKFLNMNSFPSIIQDDKYIETSTTKIKLKFSLGPKQRIQGLFSEQENKIYLYDITELNKEKKECIEIEKFLKKGFLVHELTHYKQKREKRTSLFYKETEYMTSEKESEAINNQLSYWKKNKDKLEREFKGCINQTSQEWFIKYLKESQNLNKAYQYALLREQNIYSFNSN